MKIIVKILFFIPVLYLIIMPAFFSKSAGTYPCRRVSIDIADSSDYHFITKRNLLSLVNGTSKIVGRPVAEVPVEEIERKIKGLNELKEAEIYMGVDGTMHVYADQRDPVMRVVPSGGGDYFIDNEGVIVRKRNLYNPRLHVVTGNITITQKMLSGVSVLDTSIKNTILRDIFHLVNYIRTDSFWSAQIDQIHVDGDDEIDLIPRAGSHIIHIGTVENLDGKLRNLEAFYEKVLPEVGWNKYSVINLEYRDQIVCRKKQQ
jgi:cell division protein FtsQ